MHILFLSHYFPPEVNAPASRTFEHCRQWIRQGHEVTVITCAPHHPMGKIYPGYRNRLVQTEVQEGIRVVRVLTYITANEGFLKRTFNYVFYAFMAILVSPWLRKADVVVSTSPQFFNGLAGYLVSRIKRAPWLLEIRDLWPESIVAVGALKNPRLIAWLEALERFAYRKASHVVVVTHAFKKHVCQTGIPEDRVTVIPNGVDLALFVRSDVDEAYKAELGVSGKFVAAYVGTHGMAHGLDTLLDAAELLSARDDIVILTAGDGAERRRLMEECSRRKLQNVKMLGQLPKSEMPRLWSITDVSLVILKRLDLFLTVIPSKLFESMAMGKPIILGVRGESADLVERSGAGLLIEPENAEELAAGIARLADDQALGVQLRDSGRSFVAEHYDRKKLAEQFVELFYGILGLRK